MEAVGWPLEELLSVVSVIVPTKEVSTGLEAEVFAISDSSGNPSLGLTVSPTSDEDTKFVSDVVAIEDELIAWVASLVIPDVFESPLALVSELGSVEVDSKGSGLGIGCLVICVSRISDVDVGTRALSSVCTGLVGCISMNRKLVDADD
jgi:hypothetical protein